MSVFASNQGDEPDKAEDRPHEGVGGRRHDDRRHNQERAQQDPVEHVSMVVRPRQHRDVPQTAGADDASNRRQEES
jgi:hypothetical protein